MWGGEALKKTFSGIISRAQFSTYRDVNEEESLFSSLVDAWIPIS